MSEFMCNKGHRWIEADDTLIDECPECYFKNMEREQELAELKKVIKEAVLEALSESKP